MDDSMAWGVMAERTGKPFADGGAYASDMYADWKGCVNLLKSRGMTIEAAEDLLRSKHMRWCSDGSDRDYGQTTVEDLARYIDDGRNHDAIVRAASASVSS